jgi:predicted nucleic acid binding AN1-type Zn finger protein
MEQTSQTLNKTAKKMKFNTLQIHREVRAAMELSDVGSHCEVADCKVKDFLPFRCANCKGSFCLDHRTHHGCKHQSEKLEAVFCPICKRQILVRFGENGQKNLAGS